jgi:hypothetical protein
VDGSVIFTPKEFEKLARVEALSLSEFLHEVSPRSGLYSIARIRALISCKDMGNDNPLATFFNPFRGDILSSL